MKGRILIACLWMVSTASVHAQENHVVNCSFEQHSRCPPSYSYVDSCLGWRQYTEGTPDYFHICGTGVASVPTNYFGYQAPAHGQAYTGGYVYGDTIGLTTYKNYKEYIAATIKRLEPGITYNVSMSVSLSNNSKFGTNDLGIYFFDNGPFTIDSYSVLNVSPQVSFASYGPIMDTSHWVRLSGIFTADSAYDNIVIGGFSPYSQLTLDSFGSGSRFAYYYFDSIVIRPIDTFSAIIRDSLLCRNDTLQVHVQVPNDYNSNNTFIALLSDKTGNFDWPATIGMLTSDTSGIITCIIPPDIPPGPGYKVRVVSTSPTDTSKSVSPDLKIGNPDSVNTTPTNNSPICEESLLQLSVVAPAPETFYSWSGPNGFNSSSPTPSISNAHPSQSGEYIVNLKWYGCEATEATTVTINPLPAKPVAENNSPLCAGDTIYFIATTSPGGVKYTWTGPNQFTSSIQNPTLANSTVNMSGDYILTVQLMGCFRNDTTTVLVKPQPTLLNLSSNEPVQAGDTLKLEATASSSNVSYTWSGPGNFTATTRNVEMPTAASGASGYYTITIELDGCLYRDSIYANVIEGLVLYPNPNSGSFVIKGNVPVNRAFDVKIINAIGQTIHTKSVFPTNGVIRTEITMPEVGAGLYLLKIGDRAIKFIVR